MFKIEFSFGLDLDRDGNRLSDLRIADGLEHVRREALRLFGGCTMVRTEGDWEDPRTGVRYSEQGMSLFIIAPDPTEQAIQQIAENIKRSLRQAAVYVTRYEVQSSLY